MTSKKSHLPILRKELPKPIDKERELARHLAQVYTSMKIRWTGSFRKVASENNVHYKQFKTAAKQILALQSRHHPINPSLYVWVVFSYFGVNTYPAHLASPKIWKMYHRWEARQKTACVQGVDFSTEENTLQHLCAARGQPLPDLWPKMKNSGIFTPDFVRYIDGILTSY